MPTFPRCAIGAEIRVRPLSISATGSRRLGSTNCLSAQATRCCRARTAYSDKWWEMAGVGRLQSGTPINITSGRDKFNQNDGGVVLHNLSARQLQDDKGLNFTSAIQANGVATGTAYYLPQSLVQNTLAAFAISGTLDPTAPYIGPCNTAGQVCNQVFLWGPGLSKWDVSLVKRTSIKERLNFEFRVQALNAELEIQ